jgi:hypothetical protein
MAKRNSTLIDLWNGAVPLGEAWLHFASAKMKRELNMDAAPDPNRLGLRPIVQFFRPSDSPDQVTAATIQTQHAFDNLKKQFRTEREMRDLLIINLRSGRLAALGFDSSGPIDADPIQVPSRFFDHKYIKWKANEIVAANKIIVDVRICPTKWLSPRSATSVLAKKQKTVGRPSAKHDIICAILDLHSSAPEIFAQPQKRQLPAIRQKIKTLYPGKYHGDQPADRTIMRCIATAKAAIQGRAKAPK